VEEGREESGKMMKMMKMMPFFSYPTSSFHV
jgi:hypothetical protein